MEQPVEKIMSVQCCITVEMYLGYHTSGEDENFLVVSEKTSLEVVISQLTFDTNVFRQEGIPGRGNSVNQGRIRINQGVLHCELLEYKERG